MASELSKDTADKLLSGGVITPETYQMHSSAGFAPDMTPVGADAPSDFSKSYNARLKQLQAPSPFDRPDAPQLSQEQMEQSSAGTADNLVKNHAASELAAKQSDYDGKANALKLLNSQGTPLDAMAQLGPRPESDPKLLAQSMRTPEIKGELAGRDGVGIDPSQVAGGAPPVQDASQKMLGGLQDSADKILGGLGQEQQGTQGYFEAQKKGALATQSALDSYQRKQAFDEIDRQDREQSRQWATQQKMKDVNDKVDEFNSFKMDPNRVWHNADTGQKVTAAIAIMLGGIGGALTGHGGNVALDVINKTIDRDIESQKMDFEKKGRAVDQAKSSYGMFMTELGDQRSAEAATRLAALKNVELKIQSLSAGTNAASMAPQAQMAMGKIQAQIGQTQMQLQQMIYQNHMLYGNGGGQSGSMDLNTVVRKINFLPKEAQAEAYKELPEYMKHQESKALVAKSIDDMSQYSTDYTPNGRARFNAAKTSLMSNTSELFGGKSEKEFKIMEGWVPGMTQSKQTVDYIKNYADRKQDTLKQFPILQGYSMVPRHIKMEPPK